MKFTPAITLIGWLTCSHLLAAEPASGGGDLFQAIREGDHGEVKVLLKKGADLNARDESGDTPLMAAALNADTAMLKLLLQAGRWWIRELHDDVAVGA